MGTPVVTAAERAAVGASSEPAPQAATLSPRITNAILNADMTISLAAMESAAAASIAPVGIEPVEDPVRDAIRPLVLLVELRGGPVADAEGGRGRAGPGQRRARGARGHEGRQGARDAAHGGRHPGE